MVSIPMSETDQGNDDPPNQGLCAGGPLDGEWLAGTARFLVIPVDVPGKPGIGQGRYEFKPHLQMWIWIT